MLFVTTPPSQQPDCLFVAVPVEIKSTAPRVCADRDQRTPHEHNGGRHVQQCRDRLCAWSPEPPRRVLESRIGTPLLLVALVMPQLQPLVVGQ